MLQHIFLFMLLKILSLSPLFLMALIPSESPVRKVTVGDLNLLAYLLFRGFKFEIVMKGGYAIGECLASDEFYRLCDEYENNPLVPIKSYVSHLRQIRSQVSGLKMQAGAGK